MLLPLPASPKALRKRSCKRSGGRGALVHELMRAEIPKDPADLRNAWVKTEGTPKLLGAHSLSQNRLCCCCRPVSIISAFDAYPQAHTKQLRQMPNVFVETSAPTFFLWHESSTYTNPWHLPQKPSSTPSPMLPNGIRVVEPSGRPRRPRRPRRRGLWRVTPWSWPSSSWIPAVTWKQLIF